VSRRAQAVAQQIQQTVPADQLQLKPDDTIMTADCVLVGRVNNETLKARTKMLGEMSFKLTDLRSLHSPADVPATPTSASSRTETSARQWKGTKVAAPAPRPAPAVFVAPPAPPLAPPPAAP